MLRDRLRGAKDGIERRVKSTLKELSESRNSALTASRNTEESMPDSLVAEDREVSGLETSGDEPPVVARLMIEIRSDGSRTVARGALKDELSGEQVSLVAAGTTPLALAAQLAKSLLTTPLAAGQFARAVKRAKLRGKDDNKEAKDSTSSNDDPTEPSTHG